MSIEAIYWPVDVRPWLSPKGSRIAAESTHPRDERRHI